MAGQSKEIGGNLQPFGGLPDAALPCDMAKLLCAPPDMTPKHAAFEDELWRQLDELEAREVELNRRLGLIGTN